MLADRRWRHYRCSQFLQARDHGFTGGGPQLWQARLQSLPHICVHQPPEALHVTVCYLHKTQCFKCRQSAWTTEFHVTAQYCTCTRLQQFKTLQTGSCLTPICSWSCCHSLCMHCACLHQTAACDLRVVQQSYQAVTIHHHKALLMNVLLTGLNSNVSKMYACPLQQYS